MAIDCATKLTEPMIKAFVKGGVNVFGRYLPTSAWKGLTKSEVELLSKYGCKVFSIFEDNATHLGYFTEKQGVLDAHAGEQMSHDLGQPYGTPIYYTVDFNVQRKDFPTILKYFKAIKDNLKHYEVRPYGHDAICDYLVEHGICDKVYQTYAWSGGRKSKHAVIYQYKNGQRMEGIPVDFDEVNGDIGAWKLEQPKPKPQPKKKPQPKSIATSIHEIKSGDTFWDLETENHWEHGTLTRLNKGVNPRSLRVGQKINVPHTIKSKKYHIVKSGESLSKIAPEYGLTLAEIEKLNPQIDNFDVIHPGEKIRVK